MVRSLLKSSVVSSSAFSSALAITVALCVTVGCSNERGNQSSIDAIETQAIRPLTQDEALADYDTMIATIQSLYGPLEYKERRFGYNFAKEAQAIRAKFSAAKTDFEKQSLFFEALRKLEDGHVSLSQPIRERSEIPIVIMPVEDKFLVARVAPTLAPYGIAAGDEILSVDGMTPADALKIILKYTWFANPQSDQHLAYYFFYRPSFIVELLPKESFAQIEFAKPDGSKKLARIAWKRTSPQTRFELEPRATLPGAETALPKNPKTLIGDDSMTSKALSDRLQVWGSIANMGEPAPWYWNPRLKRKYGVTMVTPERERVQMFYSLWNRELNVFEAELPAAEPLPATLPLVWAALYKHNGKTVFMVRQPSYGVPNAALYLSIYSALIDQYQPVSDVMVLDQTHNPGGSVTYGEGFVQLFAPKGLNGFVQFLNADRLWFTKLSTYWTSLDAAAASSTVGNRLLATAKGLERDSENGLRLTKEPFSFNLREVSPPAPGGAVWKKPVLVLIDELCGSGGDAIPMVLKANKLAKLFGQRTSGLGGSVEKVIDLPYTRAELRLTRGLFTTFKPDGKYTDADFVENNGVEPDVKYTHTVDDVRDGFDAYFKAFSDEATK